MIFIRSKPNEKEDIIMNMQENARLILALRAKGWTDTEINDLVLYIETGDEKYKPKKESSVE